MKQDAWEDWTKNWNNAKKFFDSKGNIKTKAKLKKKWHDDFMEIFKAHNKIVDELKKDFIQQGRKDREDEIIKLIINVIKQQSWVFRKVDDTQKITNIILEDLEQDLLKQIKGDKFE